MAEHALCLKDMHTHTHPSYLTDWDLIYASYHLHIIGIFIHSISLPVLAHFFSFLFNHVWKKMCLRAIKCNAHVEQKKKRGWGGIVCNLKPCWHFHGASSVAIAERDTVKWSLCLNSALDLGLPAHLAWQGRHISSAAATNGLHTSPS